jgi:hypothetical protein
MDPARMRAHLRLLTIFTLITAPLQWALDLITKGLT